MTSLLSLSSLLMNHSHRREVEQELRHEIMHETLQRILAQGLPERQARLPLEQEDWAGAQAVADRACSRVGGAGE